MNVGKTSIKEIFIGIVIGIAAMLPGVSGATLAVVMGIYERLIRDLADLRTWIRKDISFILFLGIGGVIGTIVSAKLLNTFITQYPAECMMLFVGLILGQIPAVYATTDLSKEKGTSSNWAAFVVGFMIMAAMIAVELSGMGDKDTVVSHDALGFIIMVLVGVIVAVSALLPGLSHSTVLIVFGLFGAFTGAVGNLDGFFIASLFIGVLVGALLFSKILQKALTLHHRTMMFLILGLTVGSLCSIIVSSVGYLDSIVHILASIVTLAIGFAIAIGFMRMGGVEDDNAITE